MLSDALRLVVLTPSAVGQISRQRHLGCLVQNLPKQDFNYSVRIPTL